MRFALSFSLRTCLPLAVLLFSVSADAAEPAIALRCDPYTVHLTANGALTRIEKRGAEAATVTNKACNAGTLVYGGTSLVLEKPAGVKQADSECTFVYQLSTTPAVTVHFAIQLRRGKENAVVLSREVTVESREKLAEDLTVKLPLWPSLVGDCWLPLFNGTAGTLGTQPAAYAFAGALPADGVRLSIPMISTTAAGISPRVTMVTDPYYSTLWTRDSVEWKYPKQVGLENGSEKRTVVTVFHSGTPEDAVGAFFAEALAEVPVGPRWLHEIAMVDYDYMSKGGKGWFADIDALAAAVPRSDRSKVFLCLHGWYDWVGRYCFDAKTGKFDDHWTAFGNYARFKDKKLSTVLGGEKLDVSFTKCVPVELTMADLHQRLAYAKSRGFRVGLYFADGLNSGKDLANFSPRNVLKWGGWQGPDTPGRSYCMNPLVPEVRQFYLAYTDALLREFGQEIDALVWDETFMVTAGSLGTSEMPGYADRAMMRLVRGVAERVEKTNQGDNRQLALLTSDCLGKLGGRTPNALMGHGTYQDSACLPNEWSYGIFPNYRNVMWSCCWYPIHKWGWIDFAVHKCHAPVAISNGYGDQTGFAEMSPEMQKKVIGLFQWRKANPAPLKFFTELPAYTPLKSSDTTLPR
jgi:hypothetical protein